MATTLTDWLTITALFLGPIFAVQAQSYLDKIRERRKKKLEIFSALMKTRAEQLSIEHVSALNMIDIAFYRKKKPRFFQIQAKNDRKVTEKWRVYFNHLCTRYDTSDQSAWERERNKLLFSLLKTIAISTGYDFDPI